MLSYNSDGADIRLFDYPNRIRLFLGLPSPTFRGQIPIRPFPYPTFSEFRVNFKKIARYSRKIFNFFGNQIRLFEILNNPNRSEFDSSISVSDILISAPPLILVLPFFLSFFTPMNIQNSEKKNHFIILNLSIFILLNQIKILLYSLSCP